MSEMDQQLEQYLSLSQKRIVLSQKGLTDRQMKVIASKLPQDINELTLEANQLTEASISIFRIRQWPCLQLLYLNSNKIGDRGARYLSQIKMVNLECIDLGSCQISSSGASHLWKTRWPSLKTFFLNDNKIAGNSINMFIRGEISKMVYINLGNNQINIQEMSNLVLIESILMKRLGLGQDFGIQQRMRLIERQRRGQKKYWCKRWDKYSLASDQFIFIPTKGHLQRTFRQFCDYGIKMSFN